MPSLRAVVRNILNISHLTLVSEAICCVQILRSFPLLQKVMATKSITCSSHNVNTWSIEINVTFTQKKRVSLWWVTQMKRYFYNLNVPSNLWNVPYMRRLMPPSMERWWGFHILRYLEMEYMCSDQKSIYGTGEVFALFHFEIWFPTIFARVQSRLM